VFSMTCHTKRGREILQVRLIKTVRCMRSWQEKEKKEFTIWAVSLVEWTPRKEERRNQEGEDYGDRMLLYTNERERRESKRTTQFDQKEKGAGSAEINFETPELGNERTRGEGSKRIVSGIARV